MKRIAVVGVGEVGRAYARALREAGHALALCVARPSSEAEALGAACSAPVHRALGSWLGDCEVTLSCVPGTQAMPVTQQWAAHARRASLLCDMSTATPDTKRTAARVAAEAGLRYVDAAIMGSVLLNAHRTPLLAAGEGAVEAAELIVGAGGVVKVIEGGAAGDAVALKILRSVFTKGLEALSVELLMVAHRQGVRDRLFDQLRDIDETPLQVFVEMLVRTHVVHARRRMHEVRDAAAELARHGVPSLVLPAVEQRFGRTVAQLNRTSSPPEPTIEQALEWLTRAEGQR
jgi:3-hydroxyisobutyrate dehydrogenase